jgi:excisionase family DNA binding protein
MSLLTYDQAAAELAVSKRTIERLVADGQLEVVEFGAARRIRPEELDRFVAACAVTRVRETSTRSPVRASRGPSSFRERLRAVS